MKQDVICPVCKEVVGRVHGQDAPKILSEHMLNHPEDYEKIAKLSSEIREIEVMYHIYSRDFFYYSTRKLNRGS